MVTTSRLTMFKMDFTIIKVLKKKKIISIYLLLEFNLDNCNTMFYNYIFNH